MRAALRELGIGPVYHMIEVMKNPPDADTWVSAFEAKYKGKGQPYTRKEWDQLLADFEVWKMTSLPNEVSKRRISCLLKNKTSQTPLGIKQRPRKEDIADNAPLTSTGNNRPTRRKLHARTNRGLPGSKSHR